MSTEATRDPILAAKQVAGRLSVVEIVTESIDDLMVEAADRVLAEPVVLDRDSPPLDVSAMDGYAVADLDVQGRDWPIAGRIPAGVPTIEIPDGSMVQIFTGAAVPRSAKAVIKREDVEEFETHIRCRPDIGDVQAGQNIRRRGENALAGAVVCQAAARIRPSVAAMMATVGATDIRLHRKVRVAILTTGDEIIRPSETPRDHQIRNSNAASVASVLGRHGWIDAPVHRHVPDDLKRTRQSLVEALNDFDAVVFCGGVSKGDHDYVPGVIADCGGTIAFHGLPLRPGRPALAATVAAKDARTRLVVGLPGNPVSATVNARFLLLPMLASMSGMSDTEISRTLDPVLMDVWCDDDKTLPLHWCRLARRQGPSAAVVLAGQGSGDLVSLAAADGFIHLQPGQPSRDAQPFYAW